MRSEHKFTVLPRSVMLSEGQHGYAFEAEAGMKSEHQFTVLPRSVMLFFSRAASSCSICCASSSCLLERAQSVAVCADRLRTFRAV
jgi:hypothetical protein